MKLILLSALLATSLFTCRDEQSDMAAIKRMEDTLFKTYPDMMRVSVEVKAHRELNVVVGSKQLYNKPAGQKQSMANEIGSMALSVFGTNNELDRGKVIFTKDERSTELNPPDAQPYNISFSK